MLAFSTFLCYTNFAVGGIAQLGERLNGIQEVSGSIPLISTKTKKTSKRRLFCFGGGRFGGEASGSMAEGHTEGEARSITLISTKTKRTSEKASFSLMVKLGLGEKRPVRWPKATRRAKPGASRLSQPLVRLGFFFRFTPAIQCALTSGYRQKQW